MWKVRVTAISMLIAGVLLGFFVYSTEVNPDSKYHFKLGLDLAGGTQLIYKADLSEISKDDVEDSMNSLRNVIEGRVNKFGVSEPRVQREKSGVFSDKETRERLIIELPGMTDIKKAKEAIGKTPVLEFKLLKKDKEITNFREEMERLVEQNDVSTSTNENATSTEDIYAKFFDSTKLTGRFLETSTVRLSQGTGVSGPRVVLKFNNEGKDLFSKITRENTGEILAIFLDDAPISMPRIEEEIPGGEAVISGNFTPEEARDLSRNLNFGALPVPIELISTQTTGPELGEEAVSAGVIAALWGLALVGLFMIFWYRVPGIAVVVSLSVYIISMLAIFKLIPVTLTTGAIAGFILSIGMAVDANILIFERLKEEIRKGEPLRDSIYAGFKWAWPSIRDGKLSTVIIAIILFWLGRSFVEGFAFTLAIGVTLSALTAITVTRFFLLSISSRDAKKSKVLFGCGFKR